MKSSEFNDAMASAFNVPRKTMVTYTRFLKEGGLLTTGARGVNAPHMKPMDAARVTIALLACDAPGQAVERVRRFGSIPYSPTFKKAWPWYENIGPAAFEKTYEGAETLEQVLAFLFGRVSALGVESAAAFFKDAFHLRITDSEVLAELVTWKKEDGKPVGEIAVPFTGDRWDNSEYPAITGHIRTTRMTTGLKFFQVGLLLAEGEGEDG